jgi:hypothetical protein
MYWVWVGIGAVFFLAWVTGVDVDTDVINVRICIEAAHVSSLNTGPSWVRSSTFNGFQTIQFYDWSKLDHSEWRKMSNAFSDYYEEISTAPDFSLKTTNDIIYNLATIVCPKDVKEFEAVVQTVMLMVVDLEIYNNAHRYDKFMEKTNMFIDRYIDDTIKIQQ